MSFNRRVLNVAQSRYKHFHFALRVALLPLLPLAGSISAFAGTSAPAGTPTAPAPVVTSTPQLSTVGAGGCAWQYTQAINDLGSQVLIANDVGLAANAVGAGAAVTGLIASEVAAAAAAASFGVMAGGLAAAAIGDPFLAAAPGLGTAAGAATALSISSGVDAVALAAAIIGAGSTVTGVASQIAGTVFAHEQSDLNTYVTEQLPLCDTTFTGTVTVTGGGVNATGNSFFTGSIGIDGNVVTNGSITSNQLHTAQGISAHGGNIWLGDPNGVDFSEGITLGGGALSGAGVGGALAMTGNAAAIAIGNGATAVNANDTAIGTGATASGGGATAIGAGSTASGQNSVVVGFMSTAGGVNDAVVGSNNNSGTGGNNSGSVLT